MPGKIIRKCEYCGIEFGVYPSDINRRFCKIEHYWEYRKIPIGARACTGCGEIKPISEFHKSSTGRLGKDGYVPKCKDCRARYRRQYYQDNRESQLEYSKNHHRDRYARNPEVNKEKYARNREKILERKRQADIKNRPELIRKGRAYYWSDPEKARKKVGEWSKRNRDKIKVRMRRYRDENREYVQDRQRRFYENNPEKAREYSQRRRALKKGPGGSYVAQEWVSLCDFYGNICLCCGIHAKDTPEGKLTVDHVIPLSKGGNNNISNIQPLCHKCNMQKGTSSTDYRPWQFEPRYKQLGFDL